jgi:hypothetical protein
VLGPSETLRTQAFVQPATQEERKAIQAQLERILSSSVFRNSKRYASVLKYLVERTLEGAGDQIKERTIGIEVFGRAPDYDTGTDHAVRSAAAEIRKRLAQYYQEQATSTELRIEILLGSYVPQFRWGHEPDSLHPVKTLVELGRETHGTAVAVPHTQRPYRGWWIAGIALLGIAALVTLFSLVKADDPIENFWGPVLASRGEVLLCVGNLEGGRLSDGYPPTENASLTLREFHRADTEVVHVNDAMTLSRIAGLVQAKGKPYRISTQTEATFTDLQNGPAVLIGLMNNDWTGRLVQNLRFTVERPGPGKVIIRDHDHPEKSDWAIDYSVPYLNVTKDYALVLRVSDPKTDQMVITVAGISAFGTLAAGEFLTNPVELRKLEAVAPKGWKQKNLELILATDVIRGKPGHATVLATHFW